MAVENTKFNGEARRPVEEVRDYLTTHIPEGWQDRLDNIQYEARSWVSRKPIASVLGAVAIGFFVGRLFKRRFD